MGLFSDVGSRLAGAGGSFYTGWGLSNEAGIQAMSRNTSFSGCDIKVLVSTSWQRSNKDDPNYQFFTSGMNQESLGGEYYVDSNGNETSYPSDPPQPAVLAELQTLSYSTYRDVTPVRAIGNVAIRGFCMGCLEENELILTTRGQKKIKDIKEGDILISFDETEKKFVKSKCLNKIFSGIKPVVEVTLENGQSVRLTKTHKVLTNNGWKKIEDCILEEDQLLIPLGFGQLEEHEVLPDYYIKFMAYVLGDGVMGLYKKGKETRFYFTPGKDDISIIDDIEKELVEHNLPYRKLYNNRGCWSIFIKNTERPTDWNQRTYNDFIQWTRTLGLYGKHSHNKFVPEILKKLDQRQTRLFLNRIFGTDGYVGRHSSKTNPSFHINYATTSSRLAKDIQYLLTKVGIYSKIKFRQVEQLGINKKYPKIIHRHGVYSIYIPQLYHYKFLTEIGIYGKESRYNSLLPDLESSIRYSYADLSKFLYEEKLFLRKRFGPSISTNKSITIKKWNLKDKLPELDLAKFLQRYQPLSEVPYQWVHINKIEQSLNLPTYDLEVENTHNLCSSFVSHNSRTIAGSMIFTQFNQQVLHQLLQPNGVPVHDSYDKDGNIDFRAVLLDQLPPFDITVIFSNEYGNISRMAIYGVKIKSEGAVMSIQDLLMENSVTYEAKHLDPIAPVVEMFKLLGDGGELASTIQAIINNPKLTKQEQITMTAKLNAQYHAAIAQATQYGSQRTGTISAVMDAQGLAILQQSRNPWI